MNFFSYHKAEEPVYRIREGAIILIDSLKQRAYKVIENLPIELKSFYLWEKVRDFQIIDPWMEFLSPKVSCSNNRKISQIYRMNSPLRIY